MTKWLSLWVLRNAESLSRKIGQSLLIFVEIVEFLGVSELLELLVLLSVLLLIVVFVWFFSGSLLGCFTQKFWVLFGKVKFGKQDRQRVGSRGSHFKQLEGEVWHLTQRFVARTTKFSRSLQLATHLFSIRYLSIEHCVQLLNNPEQVLHPSAQENPSVKL